MKNQFYLLTIITLFFTACNQSPEAAKTKEPPSVSKTLDIEKTSFGKLKTGEAIDLYTLKNAKGMTVSIMTYGGAIVRWTAPEIGRAHV